jgi:hypothetical protein
MASNSSLFAAKPGNCIELKSNGGRSSSSSDGCELNTGPPEYAGGDGAVVVLVFEEPDVVEIPNGRFGSGTPRVVLMVASNPPPPDDCDRIKLGDMGDDE